MADLTSDDLQRMIDKLESIDRGISRLHATTDKQAKESKREASRSSAPSGSRGSTTLSGDAAIIHKLIAEQNKLSGVTSVMGKKLMQVGNGADRTIGTLQKLSSAGGNVSKSLLAIVPALGRVAGAAALITKMTDAMSETTDTYRQLTQVGQTFNGSMLSMQIAAAEAALPLNEFAEVLKKNSTVIAAIGTQSFGAMSKALRVSLKDVGQLGLTTAQLNQNLGQYLDTQRLYGNLSNQSTEKTTANVRALGIETLKAAHMTGMHTEKINESAAAALKDESLRAKMLQMSANSVDTYGLALNKAVIYMSALPGEAGKTLSTMLAQTVGRGTALLTDASQTFIDAGLFGVTDMMDNMAKKVANNTWTDQDAAEFNRKFVAEGMKNMASLQMQAATDNQAAKQAIVMISEMKEIANKTPEELKAQKGVTNFLLNLGSIIERVSGLIRERFFKGLESLMTKFEGFTDSPAFTAFSAKIGDMAERFGLFLSETITPERLVAFGGGLASALEMAVKFATVIATVVEKVTSVFGWLSDKIGVLGASLTAFVAWQAAKAAGGAAMGGLGRVRELLAERFNIGGAANRQETLTQGGVQSAFEQALNRFSAGNALRVTEGGGIERGRGNRRTRGGRGGRQGARIPRTGNPLDQARQNTPRPEPRGDRRIQVRIRQPATPSVPQLPQNIPQQGPSRLDRLDSLADKLQEFRRNSAERVRNTIRNPVQTGRGVASRIATGTRNVARRAVPAARTGLRRAGRVARVGMGRVARTGGTVASGLMRGGAALARGIGPMALGSVALQGLNAITPEFTGKETINAMAQGAMLGSMLGPIGAAVGAGAGAIYANWDEITGTVSDAVAGIANFDYMGAMKSTAKFIAPLGGVLTMGATAIYDNWSTIKGTVAEGFQAISNFDYAGAMKSTAQFLAPFTGALGMGATALYNNWDSVKGAVSTGFDAISNFDYAGALSDTAKFIAPLGGALGMGAMTIYNNWDSIKGTVSEGFNAIASFDYAGAFASVASMLTPISDGVKWYVDTLWSSWKKVGSTMMNGFTTVKNWLTGGGDDEVKKADTKALGQRMDARAQTITQNWSELTKSTDLTKPLSAKFDTFVNTKALGVTGLDTAINPDINAPLSLNGNTGLDMVANQKQTPGVVAPKNPAQPTAPKLNTDKVNAKGNEWKEQTLQLQRENLETRRQMSQMLDTLANGTNQTVGGLRDLIGEQQKSNRNLDVISGNVI